MTDKEFADSYIDGIKQIANSKQVKLACEPNVISHKDISEFDVTIILYAKSLLENGFKALNG